MFEGGSRFPEATIMLNTMTSTNDSNAAVIVTNHKSRDEYQNRSIFKELYSNNEYEYEYWFEDTDINGMMMINNNNTNNNNQHIIIFDDGIKK